MIVLICPSCISILSLEFVRVWNAAAANDANDANGAARAKLVEFKCDNCKHRFWVDEHDYTNGRPT